MPFTFAHPAIVLPFGKIFKRGLSVTGLVIGSMSPDFEYFFRMRIFSAYSHTWEGLVWFDVPLAFVLVILYEIFIKEKLITHLPGGLNRRFYYTRQHVTFYTVGYFIAILASVALGAASHIAWDGFSHPNGMYVHQWPVLQRVFNIYGYHLYGFTILQHGSTLLGLLFIAIVCLALPKGELTRAKSITGFWLQVVLVTAVTVAIKLAAGLQLNAYSNVIISIIDGGLLGLVVSALLSE
ncbi:MAG: DUF4184 family protein [Mucilaginibacter sp.]